MTRTNWPEVESQVYSPYRWILPLVGMVFFIPGIVAFLVINTFVPPGISLWLGRLGTAAFAAIGAIPIVWFFISVLWPAKIRHAAGDALSDVPDEPVVWEGAIVHGNLTHELVEDRRRWVFRPSRRLRRSINFMLFGFGIPFMIFSAGLLSWVFHKDWGLENWAGAIILAVFMTFFCGGTALVVIWLIMRSGYRQLSSLSIPKNGNPLELDMPVVVGPKDTNGKKDLIKGLKWLAQEGSKRQQLEIPRDWVCAVQLCPWKYVYVAQGRTIHFAVEGLLVLRRPDETSYVRLPIMLTGHFVGAARLMQKLAHTLNVPYLFHADAEGWRAEIDRARTRTPLQSGGCLG